MPAPKGPVMLRISNSDTQPCQKRWLLDSIGTQRRVWLRFAIAVKCWRKPISTHPVGGTWRWWFPSVWKKWTARVAEFGDQVLERERVASDDRCRESSLEVTTWPTCLRSSDRSSNHPSHKDGRSTFPHSAAPTPQAPLAPVLPHRAACSEAGVLGRRGFALEVAAAQVCREAGARVSTNVFVRDMDLTAFDVMDSRRLEVVADGLNWPSTRHSCPLSDVTALQDLVL